MQDSCVIRFNSTKFGLNNITTEEVSRMHTATQRDTECYLYYEHSRNLPHPYVIYFERHVTVTKTADLQFGARTCIDLFFLLAKLKVT